jgi:hypothetical protein
MTEMISLESDEKDVNVTPDWFWLGCICFFSKSKLQQPEVYS